MDAVQMEVVYRATAQIARELALNMLRTGYSSVIKESQDFTFTIFDGAGRMVTQGLPQPLHIGGISAQVGEVIRGLRRRHGGGRRLHPQPSVPGLPESRHGRDRGLSRLRPGPARGFHSQHGAQAGPGRQGAGHQLPGCHRRHPGGAAAARPQTLPGGRAQRGPQDHRDGQHPDAGDYLGGHPGPGPDQLLRAQEACGADGPLRLRRRDRLLARVDGPLRGGGAEGHRDDSGRELRSLCGFPRRRRARSGALLPHRRVLAGGRRRVALLAGVVGSGPGSHQPPALRHQELHRPASWWPCCARTCR